MNYDMNYDQLDSPLGRLSVFASECGITGLYFAKQTQPQGHLQPAHPILLQAKRELTEYFAQQRCHFEVAVDLRNGTPFQQTVWRGLLDVPYAQTETYANLAQRIGHTGAARAVGTANGRNPVAIIVPCHRIIGAQGNLCGYAGGLKIKQALLNLEAGEIRWASVLEF